MYKFFLAFVLAFLLVSCDQVRHQQDKVLSPHSTQMTIITCQTIFGLPYFCYVRENTETDVVEYVQVTEYVEVIKIIEKIVEVIVVEEKRVEVPVETIVYVIQEKYIDVPATPVEIARTIVENVETSVGESNTIDDSISVATNVVRTTYTTPTPQRSTPVATTPTHVAPIHTPTPQPIPVETPVPTPVTPVPTPVPTPITPVPVETPQPIETPKTVVDGDSWKDSGWYVVSDDCARNTGYADGWEKRWVTPGANGRKVLSGPTSYDQANDFIDNYVPRKCPE